MATRTAVVSRINHDAETIDAFDVNAGVIEGIPFDGFPPAPLSTVRLVDGPAWRVDRQIGPARQLFYDDFTEGGDKLLRYSERTANSAYVGVATSDINVTATLEAGRRYRIRASAHGRNNGATGGFLSWIDDGGTIIGYITVDQNRSNVAYALMTDYVEQVVVGDGASHTYTVRFQPWVSGTARIDGSAAWPSWIALYEEGTGEVGDTAWHVVDGYGYEGTAGVNTVRPVSIDDALGAVELTLDDTSQNYVGIAKATNGLIVPPSDKGLWFGARIRMPSSGVGTTLIGFRNDESLSTDRYAVAQFDQVALGAIQLQTEGSGTNDTQNTGTAPVLATWYVIDVVLIAGLFAALWVDGDGPWIITDPDALPAEGDGIHPMILFSNNEGAAGSMYVDWCHTQQFSQANDPTAFAVSGVQPVG